MIKGRYDAILNGVSLWDVSPQIIVLDIQHGLTQFVRNTYKIANRSGAVADSQGLMSSAGVTVVFAIRERNVAKRQEICQRVITWARDGGVLEVSDRPGKQLLCRCERLTAIDSALKWASNLTITFAGNGNPFWTDVVPSSAHFTGTGGAGQLYVPGTAPFVYAEISATVASTLAILDVRVGETRIRLENLDCGAGDKVVIRYDNNGIQHIEHNGQSILSKRTADSSDDLIAVCGKPNNIVFVSDAVVSLEVSAGGAWL